MFCVMVFLWVNLLYFIDLAPQLINIKLFPYFWIINQNVVTTFCYYKMLLQIHSSYCHMCTWIGYSHRHWVNRSKGVWVNNLLWFFQIALYRCFTNLHELYRREIFLHEFTREYHQTVIFTNQMKNVQGILQRQFSLPGTLSHTPRIA